MYPKRADPTTAVTPKLFQVTGPFLLSGDGLPSATLLKFLTNKLDPSFKESG